MKWFLESNTDPCFNVNIGYELTKSSKSIFTIGFSLESNAIQYLAQVLDLGSGYYVRKINGSIGANH